MAQGIVMPSKATGKTESVSKKDLDLRCCKNSNCCSLSGATLYCLSNMDGGDYASKQYWNQRYADGSIEHEWYYSYELLEPIVRESRLWKSSDCVLEVGCGDKPLIHGFLNLGLNENNLIGIDYSKPVIDMLKAQQQSGKFPKNIQLEDLDACDMHYDDNFFDFICEKGTMDAILSDSQPSRGIRNSVRMISEIVRVMKSDGIFLLVSHIQIDSDEFEVLTNDILMPSLATKGDVHWKIEAHVVNQSTEDENEDEQPRKRQKKSKSDSKHVKNKPEGYGTVYLIRSIPRKMTRHSSAAGEVSFEVKSYDE